jgi:anti-sigma factor RsiW
VREDDEEQRVDLACRQVVELVTDYLEDALPASLRVAVEQHLLSCPHCVTYVEQVRTTAASLRDVPAESISPQARDELVAAFRDLLPPSGRRPVSE